MPKKGIPNAFIFAYNLLIFRQFHLARLNLLVWRSLSVFSPLIMISDPHYKVVTNRLKTFVSHLQTVNLIFNLPVAMHRGVFWFTWVLFLY